MNVNGVRDPARCWRCNGPLVVVQYPDIARCLLCGAAPQRPRLGTPEIKNGYRQARNRRRGTVRHRGSKL